MPYLTSEVMTSAADRLDTIHHENHQLLEELADLKDELRETKRELENCTYEVRQLEADLYE